MLFFLKILLKYVLFILEFVSNLNFKLIKYLKYIKMFHVDSRLKVIIL